MPDFSKYAKSYDTHVEASLSRRGEDLGFFAQYKVELAARRLANPRVQSVLDFGCGPGSGNLFVFERNPFNPVTRLVFERCPFDQDAEMLRLSATRSAGAEAGLSGPVGQTYSERWHKGHGKGAGTFQVRMAVLRFVSARLHQLAAHSLNDRGLLLGTLDWYEAYVGCTTVNRNPILAPCGNRNFSTHR